MPRKIAVIDEDLPRIMNRALLNLGWIVKDVRDEGLKGKSDSEIASFARRSRAVLFTGDWDFANILVFPPKNYYGIVILSFPNELSTELMARETTKLLSKISFRDYKHNLIVIEPGRVRIRPGE